MQSTLTANATFEIASDGSHNPTTHNATFGWVISLDKQLIAKGCGPAPADPDMSNPFRAEAYGVASAMAFLNIFIQHFRLNITHYAW